MPPTVLERSRDDQLEEGNADDLVVQAGGGVDARDVPFHCAAVDLSPIRKGRSAHSGRTGGSPVTPAGAPPAGEHLSTWGVRAACRAENGPNEE